jgi:isoleucyl-tRNA synthetase
MYTEPANSNRRRSTQTTLHRLLTGLSQMLAPILAFTADEAWEFIPGKTGSVHETVFRPADFTVGQDEQLLWQEYFELRKYAKPTLEIARQNKVIGKDLEACLILHFPREAFLPSADTDNVDTVSTKHGNLHYSTMRKMVRNREDFREIMNVSQLVLTDEQNHELTAMVHAHGQKCERCWRWQMDVGQTPEHPTICTRCVEAVKQSGK